MDLACYLPFSKFFPAFRHFVQSKILLPAAFLAHCKFGFLRVFGIGLYFVARTRFE